MPKPIWKYVIVHHSASQDTDELEITPIEDYHIRVNGWDDIGYHFVVERAKGKYRSLMGRPLDVHGAHAPSYNYRGIGVCFAGNFEQNEMDPQQLEEGADLIAGLCYAQRIPWTHIKRHNQTKATACPGKFFPWNELLAKVRERLS